MHRSLRFVGLGKILASVEGDAGTTAEGQSQAAECLGNVLGNVQRDGRREKEAVAHARHNEVTAKAADENGGDGDGSESRSRESLSV